MYSKVILRFFLLTVLLIFQKNSNGEIRSGFWSRTVPSEIPGNSEVDLSELLPFCVNESTGEMTCSLIVADCRFTLDNRGITAQNGILFDSTLDVKLQELVSEKLIKSDWMALFYLDSMMKKMELVAPENGYVDSISVQKNSFFIKTDENHYALMMKVNEYIGGLDHYVYYWAYNADSENELYKDELVTVTPDMSLTVGVDVFSGRENPEFVTGDSAAVVKLVHTMYLSVNSLLDETILYDDSVFCPSALGYRGLSISGRIVPYSPWDSYNYAFKLCQGRLGVVAAPGTQIQPGYIDINSRLEKEIIRVCCDLGLMSTSETDAVSFCEVIPDSLKTEVAFSGRRSSPHAAVQSRYRLSNDNGIHFWYNGGEAVRIEAINLQGKCLTIIENRKSAFDVNLSRHNRNAGLYLIRIQVGNQIEVIPVVLP